MVILYLGLGLLFYSEGEIGKYVFIGGFREIFDIVFVMGVKIGGIGGKEILGRGRKYFFALLGFIFL